MNFPYFFVLPRNRRASGTPQLVPSSVFLLCHFHNLQYSSQAKSATWKTKTVFRLGPPCSRNPRSLLSNCDARCITGSVLSSHMAESAAFSSSWATSTPSKVPAISRHHLRNEVNSKLRHFLAELMARTKKIEVCARK